MTVRQGGFLLNMEFTLRAGWSCLFGVSGSGKSTVLRGIAGFLRPESGFVELFGRYPQVLFDSKAGVFVPGHLRGVRSAGQRAWMFPGNVRRNVGYGARGEIVERMLQIFQLEALAAVDVQRLSGGEQQRVSVARAAAAAVSSAEGSLLLLDEPFAGMDGALRDVLAVELKEYLLARDVAVLSVTHDVGEAFLLASDVIRISAGRVVEQGPVEIVLAEERRRVLGALG